jgi:hypothetical protein
LEPSRATEAGQHHLGETGKMSLAGKLGNLVPCEREVSLGVFMNDKNLPEPEPEMEAAIIHLLEEFKAMTPQQRDEYFKRQKEKMDRAREAEFWDGW